MSTIKYDQPYRIAKEGGCLRQGAIVYRLASSDYGFADRVSRDTGVEYVSVTLKRDGGWPGISVPTHVLEPVPFKPHLTLFGEGYWACGENTKNAHLVSIGESPESALAFWHSNVQRVTP